LQTNRPPRPN